MAHLAGEDASSGHNIAYGMAANPAWPSATMWLLLPGFAGYIASRRVPVTSPIISWLAVMFEGRDH